ncbi:MAG: LysM peptidoglycan-binding domain-containing protein [Deltaproteobacteria bacterium]|nr:LysM peptidoglycan-binding domain-containing protein [Deltaproteobacteria bacterium]
MRRHLVWLVAACTCLGTDELAAQTGKVELPLDRWEQMKVEIEQADRPHRPEIPFCPITRSVEGEFRKGLFRGSLTAEFELLDDRGHNRIPVLDGSASLGKVLLDGKRTSLLREGGMYTLGVDRPGRHAVQVEMFLGKEQDRFARRLQFRLPDAGVTRLSVYVPEPDIEAALSHGALTRQVREGDGTRLEGHLDASGQFDLSWTRKLTHREVGAVRMQARVNTLYTVREGMVAGLAVFDLAVLEGETDRIDLRLPPEKAGVRRLEVLDVQGDAVLQWTTDVGKGGEGGRLTVMLRYLLEDQARIAVRFQFPAEADQEIPLRMPLTPADVPLSGAIGVLGPAGLNIEVTDTGGAQKPKLRDLPGELTELTTSPLQHGFVFEKPPAIRLRVTAHDPLKQQATTLCDEMQASSVVLEDGTEITKLKLRIRNNARQYLKLELPTGAVLTHSLIDGRPVRPADSSEGARKFLKLPLRQSERLEAGQERSHLVRQGETLSDISNFYYSDPGQWQFLLDNNGEVIDSAQDLYPGMELRIPVRKGVTMEESSFVIELAYKLLPEAGSARRPLGWAGGRSLRLPGVDVDVMKVTWHLYFPATFSPLCFDTNLTQYTAIRYDPFRRLRDFFDRAMWIQDAWAGGYRSILKQRKAIYYTADLGRRAAGEEVLATFPLVGKKYRFKRNLLRRETPRIEVTYVATWLASPLRWLAFLLAFALGLVLAMSERRLVVWIVSALCLIGLLALAHYFLGMHRRILWGVDLALLLAVLRLRWAPFWEGLKEILYAPWTIVRLLALRNLAFVVGLLVLLAVVLWLPLLLSSISLFALFFWYRRKARLAREEVAHA